MLDPMTTATILLGLAALFPAQVPARAAAAGMLDVVEPLYAVQIFGDDELLLIDKHTALAAVIGATGSVAVTALAFDLQTGQLFATDVKTEELLIIDPESGSSSVVGGTGLEQLQGLAITLDGTLYATDGTFSGTYPSNLYRLDRATGAAQLVGPTGFMDVGGLDVDPTTGVLYAASGQGPFGQPQLLVIDPSTGAGTVVGSTVPVSGLAFDSQGQLYGVDPSFGQLFPSRLFRIDKQTGAGTLVGDFIPTAALVHSLAFEPVVSECFLVIGDDAGSAPFFGNQHPFQTQVGGLQAWHPVSLTELPEFVLPVAPPTVVSGLAGQAAIATMAGRGLATSGASAGESPQWMQDQHFTVQVVMWNPEVFPGQPEQFTAGLSVTLGADGTVSATPYGTSVGGLELWHELGVDAAGRPVIRFPFSIPGF